MTLCGNCFYSGLRASKETTMEIFIKLFKKYFLWLFFLVIIIQVNAFLLNFFSFKFISPENFAEDFERINVLRSEISFWFLNIVMSIIIIFDLKKLSIKSNGVIFLSLLSGLIGVTIFLFKAYYELTKTDTNE